MINATQQNYRWKIKDADGVRYLDDVSAKPPKDHDGQKDIALLATSSCFSDQEILQERINILVERGYRIYFAEYDDSNILAEKEVEGRKSGMLGSLSPAVSGELGARQIIEAIEMNVDIMPFMGGQSFAQKLAPVIDYFKENPCENHIKIYGYSDATFATTLQSHLRNNVEFISSPFTGTFYFGTDAYQQKAGISDAEKLIHAQEAALLDDLLKKGAVPQYPHKIISGVEQLESLQGERITLYALHHENYWKMLITEGGELGKKKSEVSLNIQDDDVYALTTEGFIQWPSSFIGYDAPNVEFMEVFLRNLQNAGKPMPKFIDMGLFSTRLDGRAGYLSLFHDENGLIAVDGHMGELNVDKLIQHQEEVRASLLKADNDVEKVGMVNNLHDYVTSCPKTRIPESLLLKVANSQEFTREDMLYFLGLENEKIKEIQTGLIHLAETFNIAVTTNSHNGHCLNMSVVGGGENVIQVNDGTLVLEHLDLHQDVPSITTTLKSQKKLEPKVSNHVLD